MKWRNQIITWYLRGLFYGGGAAIVISIVFPLAVHASIFSLVSGLFSPPSEITAGPAPTSQNIPLLQAALNPDPNPAKGGGDITVVGNAALMPETGPSGSIADIAGNPGAQISLYVVRNGDTLSEIAEMFGVSVNTLVWANDVSAKTLQPGQTLVILPISGTEHVVKAGDTLQSIAAKYKADAKEIIQFNNLIPNEPLSVGATIIIPDGEGGVSASSSGFRPTEPLHGTGGPDYVGYYAAPLVSYVKTQGLHGYNAVDLAAPIGTPIMAAAPGIVIVSKNVGWNGGYGEYVVIAHGNGTETLYAHMSENISYPGMHVVRGQVIGYVGSTGKSTGPHLHFEVRGAKNPFGP